MKFKYSIQNIPGKGKGMIAEEFIAKGTLIWEFEQEKVKIFNSKEELISYVESSSEESHKECLNYIYGMGESAILLFDDTKYWNHSKNPNLEENKDLTKYYACRDIQKGEEITMNYLKCQIIDWLEKLLKDYGFDNTMDAVNYE